MEADNIDGKKEPKRLPVWACISLFIVVLFIFIGLYGTLVSGGLSLVLGVEARHPGVVGYIFVEASMLLAVLTAAVILLRLERRPFSDLGLSLKGHASGLWYGLLMAILLYLLGFGISVVLGEIEVTGFQFKPLDLLGSWVFFLLVALFEEILMRGYILGRLLHTNMNKFLALFISSALFAFMHIFNPEIAFLPMLNLLLAGMLLGEIEVTGFQFKPLDLLGSWVFFLLVALFEEILMRGYILGRLLHTNMNKFLALFISSALFAFMHIFNPEIAFLPMLNLLLAGMLLGASYLYTRNLCFPISLHLFWNWIQGPILGYQVSGNNFTTSMLTLRMPEENVLNGGAFGFEGSLICTVLMIVFTILIVWWGEKREAISLAVPRSY